MLLQGGQLLSKSDFRKRDSSEKKEKKIACEFALSESTVPCYKRENIFYVTEHILRKGTYSM